MSEERVSVLVVDDEPDLRALIKTVLELDGRYLVVGEAGDGAEGVELAGALRPDVVVLDKSMPRMSGLDALPRIHEAAPDTVVVLYTAENDQQVKHTAMASGAAGVLTKDGSIKRLAAVLSDALLASFPDPEDGLQVQVGPVPSDAALDWIDSSGKIIAAVGSSPAFADVDIAPEIIELFGRYLDTWREIAEASPEFVWTARASPADVEQLLEAWVTIDAIHVERLRAEGLSWATARGTIFKSAITESVLDVVRRRKTLQALTHRLQQQWDP